MFKKSRRKIVAAIMSVLVLLWVGTLGIIYVSSYFEVSKQNKEMLQAHARMYSLSNSPDDRAKSEKRPHDNDRVKPNNDDFDPDNDDVGPEGDPDFDPGAPMFQLTTFYTVAVSYDSEILEIKNERPMVHTDEDLENFSQQIIDDGTNYGSENNLVFYKTDKGGYTLVTFMDNTVVYENAMTLYRYTLIFGSVALVVFFFLSVFLARRIVNPLEESYKKQKQFISDAGHELKTPVSVVSANAELLSREMGENRWLQNIVYENERMGMLVGQLLELARTENMVPIMEHIDFSRLVAGEVLPFESVAFEKGFVLNSVIDGGVCVEGNSTQLRQIVSILLDNAIRHSKGEGEIKLTLTSEHGFARLTVINKGDEIPELKREQIFERFYRMDTARSGDDRHYGLGLAIAKAITISHKGNIGVQCFDGFVEFKVQIPTL